MRWSLSAMTLLSLGACATELDEHGTFHQELAKRYGQLNTNMHFGDSPRLNLEFTGWRWRGFEDGVADSAEAVARFALARLPKAWPRPDTIQVKFRIHHMDLIVTRSTAWRGDTIAVADL